jgi:2-phospho-L-lactate guanylyltransferase
MQATVSRFDAGTASGTVLLDDGVELAFGATALRDSGLRLLRAGQRVRISTAGQGPDLEVTELTIVTLP